ncbi:hypothetical protein HDE_06671 [Halotydeus destructor]|nr:hypothetical protein HDE_06671 [Halotydeus destructor]
MNTEEENRFLTHQRSAERDEVDNVMEQLEDFELDTIDLEDGHVMDIIPDSNDESADRAHSDLEDLNQWQWGEDDLIEITDPEDGHKVLLDKVTHTIRGEM